MFLLHSASSSLPPICPCDMANASDTKSHLSAKELHQVMGCQKFCNYKHLLHMSGDGEWVDGGKFPPLLGSFATIPKAKRGHLLDWTSYHYLEAVHMDIAFRPAFWLADFDMRSSWWIVRCFIMGHLVQNPSVLNTSLELYVSFVLLPVLLPNASTLIAILSCLVLQFWNILLTMILKLSWLLLSINLPTAWWSLIGRLWFSLSEKNSLRLETMHSVTIVFKTKRTKL
jgi:hypothetical protein